jgi:hypothetical protein
MNLQYSKKETLLFQQLGYEDLLTQEPAVLYRMVALNLFKQNKTGVLVDSVRRCLNAIKNLMTLLYWMIDDEAL